MYFWRFWLHNVTKFYLTILQCLCFMAVFEYQYLFFGCHGQMFWHHTLLLIQTNFLFDIWYCRQWEMALDKPKKFIVYFKLGNFDENINISEGVLVASICQKYHKFKYLSRPITQWMFCTKFRTYFAFYCLYFQIIEAEVQFMVLFFEIFTRLFKHITAGKG